MQANISLSHLREKSLEQAPKTANKNRKLQSACRHLPHYRQDTTSRVLKEAASWLNGNFELSNNNGVITAINNDCKEQMPASNKLHIIKDSCIEVGKIKGNKIVPSHQLALSPQLRSDAFNRCEVDYLTAIAYLRGEAITINAPTGYILITYQNAILGFVNNLGNRANNLYPKSWRILSSHIPPQQHAL